MCHNKNLEICVDKDWLKDFDDDKDVEEKLEDIEDNIVYV